MDVWNGIAIRDSDLFTCTVVTTWFPVTVLLVTMCKEEDLGSFEGGTRPKDTMW